MIVRDRKGEDFTVELFVTFHSFVEFDNTSYGNSHTVSVLSVCDIKGCGTALHLACQEREVHPVSCDEKGVLVNAADKRIKLIELLVGKCGLPESNRVIWLRPWTLHWYVAYPAFINTFR